MIEMIVVTLESCCIRGYHVYCNIWDVTIGEELLCDCEPSNEWDGYVINDGIVMVTYCKNNAYLFLVT